MTKFELKTPVVLIIFNRPETTEKVFEVIREAQPPQLFVIADAPRPNKLGEAEKCMAARGIINRVDWECEVLTNYAEINLGCRDRVSSGLNWVFSLVESAIILEDDCVAHPSFFRFCEELLERYRDNDRIMTISGDNLQFGNNPTEYSYYFSRYPHCWGWATWRRAWQYYDNQMKLWSKLRDSNWLENILQNAQAVKYWSEIFQNNYQGFNSWAYAWLFAGWSQNCLTILPKVNLVSNIGFGREATHTSSVNRFANMPVSEIFFPLNHPALISRNVQADYFTEKTMFSGSLPEQCKICGAASYYFDNAKILEKYNVNYFQCSNCGFVQTENPYWLTEAYAEAIAGSDVGLVARNIELAQITENIINNLFNRQDKFLDYGCGYGLLVRLMRDSGLDFYGYDRYCENIFAKGFEARDISEAKYELVTAFEVFEHLVNPIAEIEKILKFSRNILFSTKLLPKENPKPQDWWYYALSEGQHISIYTFKALSIIAARFKLKLYSYENSLHLLTEKEIYPVLLNKSCQIEPTKKQANILTEQKYLKIIEARKKNPQELVNSQLKVLVDGVFFQLNNTGIARVWKSLLSAWANDGFAKHILVLDRGGSAPKIPGIEYRIVPWYEYNKIESDRQILQEICDAEKADLFISTYYTTPISTPSVFMAYDMIPEMFRQNLNHPEWREKHNGIRHAVSYITISENTARDLIKYFPNISSDLVTVAHCGVDSNFSISSSQEVSNFQLKYKISKPYFLVVGERVGWQGYKNTTLFFQAFYQLQNSEKFEIVCVGGKPVLETELKRFISESKIHLLQLSDDELKTAYSGAVALIYPSKYEGFGMPIVEAMACGCPVITCPKAAIPEVAGTAVFYVNDADINGLVNALSEVQKPEVRKSLIDAGLAQAKKFSWSQMAKTISSGLIETANKIVPDTTQLIKVSAIVSTYNSEKFLQGCLEDLVNQTLYKKGELEIIIIDSASEENERAIAQEFQTKYPNIIYQRTPERETIYSAWNRAIKIAKGKYITNANTDDRHRPDALEKMANYLDNNVDTSLVYGDQIITTLPNDKWETTQANKRWNWPKFDYSELERRCIIGPQPMWRKSVHEKYGYFRSEFSVAGDYEFWLRIGKTEKIERLPEILGLYYENQQGLEKADPRATQETYNICNEYGIIQRGVQRKTSVTTQIYESELMTLPYRHSDLVSVIILCYNQAQYLTEAVESIVKQTYQNWECLIVNDGSSDQTAQVAINLVEKYSEKSLRLIEKENTGVPDSRNVGINHSSGKFILFVDADDKIHPNFIAETLAVLNANREVGFVYTDIQKFGFEEKLESYGDFNVKRFLSENQAPVTSLFRREIYQQVGGFKTVMKEGWEDWEFWVSAYQKGWLGYRLEKPYLYYRQHSDGSRQQKLHQNPVNLAVHKAIIIYLHSQLYSQQEVVWSEQILYKYRNSLMTELNQLKSQLAIKYPQILPISGGNDRPFWSVMIPTYNPTSTLEQTLKSVLEQAANINEIQIEVVDDSSTQVDVEEVVKKIGQGRISYYRQPQNMGLVANWNDCIKRASGQWVHILHQDDFVLPGFYSRLGNLLENEPQVGASFCRHYYIDENDNQKMLSPLEKETPGIISHWLEKIAVMQRIQCASIVVKRSVYEQVGGFCPEANSAADWEMWKRIAAYYPVAYEPEPLACYRWHSTSESSRLIKFGGNIADTRKAIQISESYLPPEIATKLSNQAREHYAISATQMARQMLGVGETKSAIAQIQEALKCSQSSQVKEAIISLFLTSDSTPQINTNQLLSEIYNYVEQYQKDFSNQSVLNHLRQLRQQIANYWLNLPTEKLESAYLSDVGKAHQKLMSSSLKYEQITDTEKSFVNQIKIHIEGGLNQQNSIQYLLAATLYYYPHQLSPNWFEQAPIPKWFVNDYMKFMIDAPSYFQKIGEADNYYRYTLNWSNYLHQRICSNSDSKIWQDIAWFFTQKTNFIPLYFNSENLKEIYIKRAEIMEIALQSRGFKLDYTFPERPVNRNKIRLGILSSHFTPQTETFSTLPVFEHLDKTKFEIILYTKNLTEYPLEKYCQSRAERLVKLPDNLMSQVETIRTDDLDILLIGTNITAITNPITLLALHRLARIQLTSTSSCTTTGMRHIDYYISGNLTEPKQEAQQQYREQLITLKGAAHCFNYYATEPEKPVVKPGRESWGITDENIVFVSGANFYKIIPELRETWAKIIAAVPNSILVLYPFNPNWSNSYQAGTHFVNDMRSIFSKYGIDKKRLIVIKTLPSRSDIKECLKLCDVYLDSYPFAGVNSLVEPLEIGLPIVTKDGNSFRSLMGTGLLRSLSIPDLITDNETAYIHQAIKLANNPEFRQQKRQKIQAKMQQNPPFLDSRAYGKEIGELFQELFQKWQNIHTPKTIESTGENYLNAEFLNRLVGCVNLYEIDPTDQSLIEELRQLRKQIADFWLETPPKELETVYQGKIRQAYQALLASGIQNEPQTEDEQKFLKELVNISLGLTNPKAVNALLGGMLYFPPGKMLVRDAKNRLPQWLINDYKQVFESREVAQKLEEAFKSKSPHLPEESTDRGLVTKPLQADEFKPEKNVVLTENKADNLETTQQKFLNQLFGSVNLYYIDPSDESVVKELRQVRKQMADFWINLEPKKLETFYLGEMGKGYKALLSSGIQNQTLTDSEQTFLQELATQLAKGIEAPKAINYFLGAMLYCRQGQLQVQDSSKLPQWLEEDYYKFVSK